MSKIPTDKEIRRISKQWRPDNARWLRGFLRNRLIKVYRARKLETHG